MVGAVVSDGWLAVRDDGPDATLLVKASERIACGWIARGWRVGVAEPPPLQPPWKSLPSVGGRVFRTEAEARGWCLELFDAIESGRQTVWRWW